MSSRRRSASAAWMRSASGCKSSWRWPAPSVQATSVVRAGLTGRNPVAKGKNTSGYSSPLDLCTVTTCTRSASLSSRTICSSAVAAAAPSIWLASQRIRACSPSCWALAACSSSARCSTLVRRRSPPWPCAPSGTRLLMTPSSSTVSGAGWASQRAGRPRRCRVWRSMVSTPCCCQMVCNWRSSSLRASKASSSVARWASSASGRPTSRVASAARASRISRGDAMAVSQRSRSAASALMKTDSWSDRYTDATWRRCNASRTAAASRPVRTSTAMSAGRRRCTVPSGCLKPAAASPSKATICSAQRAANWRWWVWPSCRWASSTRLSAGTVPALHTSSSGRPRAATGLKGSGLSGAAPAAALRYNNAPAPGRNSACSNSWLTAATSAAVERWLVPST